MTRSISAGNIGVLREAVLGQFLYTKIIIWQSHARPIMWRKTYGDQLIVVS